MIHFLITGENHMKSFLNAALVALALELGTGPSWAQSDDERAGARAAAEQAVKAYAEGRWADTVDLMSRAEKLVHAPTHLLYIGQAEEKLGHLVSANETYLKVTREKLRPDAPEAFVSAQEEAKRRAEAIRGRLSQVSIVVQGASPQSPVEVVMDGKKVPEALLGVPHPVDPGEHKFEARATTMQSGTATIQLREGGSETVVLTLQNRPEASANSGVAATLPTTKAGDGNQPSSSDAAPTPSPSEGSSGMKIGGYVSLGVGVVGAGIGTGFLIRYLGKHSDANALCPNGECQASNASQIHQLDSDAKTAGTVAIVGFTVGGIGLAAGVTMLLLSRPSDSRPPKTAWVRPYVGPNSAGIYGGF
jgi:hypothetical protein